MEEREGERETIGSLAVVRLEGKEEINGENQAQDEDEIEKPPAF